jgi:hypothetical protein
MAPMADVLDRVASELRQAAVLIDQTPVCTEHVKEGMGSADQHYVRAMQSLDHSAQKLAGLADFLSALAAGAPSHWRIDPATASKVITLAELANRLSLPSAAEEGVNGSASGGDCEFF